MTPRCCAPRCPNGRAPSDRPPAEKRRRSWLAPPWWKEEPERAMQHMTFNPATAIEGTRPSAIACCRFVCLNPVTLAVSFLVAVIVGTWAGPVAAVLAVVVAGAVLLAASPLPMTRRLVAPILARKARRDRHERQR